MFAASFGCKLKTDLLVNFSDDSIALDGSAFGHSQVESENGQLCDVVLVFSNYLIEVHHRLQSAFINRITPAKASKPNVGSPIAKPAIVTDKTVATAIVNLIMFSNLIPFCVWYVNYGPALQVLLIYKDFVIVLLFRVNPGD